jgi:hypothetical protein
MVFSRKGNFDKGSSIRANILFTMAGAAQKIIKNISPMQAWFAE